MRRLLARIPGLIPEPMKWALRKIGLHKLYASLLDKHSLELLYQMKWADKFRKNKHKVLEYWRRYRFLDEIKAILDEECPPARAVLDVGCGISTVLHFIDAERKVGIDPLAGHYKAIYEYPRDIEVIEASGESLPFQASEFDAAFCTNVLDHVSDPRATLSEIFRVLKPGGIFVLTVEIFGSRIKRDNAHPHSLTESDVEQMLDEAGFETIRKWKSPWIGLGRFVDGETSAMTEEVVAVLRKPKA